MMRTMRKVRGFTLVETLVAITVILTAIVGPLYAVQQSLNISRSAREQLIASSLAQEGVEYVRAMRDSNYLYNLANPGSRTWLAGVDGTAGYPNAYADCITGNCVVDIVRNTVSRTVVPLNLEGTGLYGQTSAGTATPFTRTVRLTAVAGSVTEMIVTVTVTWTTKGQARTVLITERLHNWL
jgi:prepilin-type N-terminal cleavage/methylation domain-containing protein